MKFADRDGYVVRIYRQGSQIAAGIGFVVADKYVVTCAHVINTALGRAKDVRDAPDPEIRFAVDFPILGDADGASPARSSKLVKWEPPAAGLWSGGDVAGLQLVGEGLPVEAGAARLISHDSVRDAAVDVFGYPPSPTGRGTSRDQGTWARLRLRSAVGGGSLQLDTDTGAAWQAQPGYSGSPVVVVAAEGEESVVGMLVAAISGGGRDAYAIPAEQIAAAWPEVLQPIGAEGGAISPDQNDARPADEAAQAQGQPAATATAVPNPFPATMQPAPPTPASLPVVAVPAAIAQPTLPQVIAGNWAVDIQNPMGQVTLMLTMAVQPNGQLVFEGFFVGMGQSVGGMWGVTNNQVTLAGWRSMGGGPWAPRAPYQTTVTFASWSHAQLQGTTSGGEPVIWRRQP